MASRGQYLLRISGRTRPTTKSEALIELKSAVEEIFATAPSKGTGALSNAPGDRWPTGFLLRGYSVCQWHLSPLYSDKPYEPKHKEDRDRYLSYPDENTIDFLAEAHHTLTGSLYFNRHTMLDEVRWFYHHREYEWHRDLVNRLEKLNARFASVLLERVWFRDWKWYCGNGGC